MSVIVDGRHFPGKAFAAAWKKDPEFYDSIPGYTAISSFLEIWRERYPEDFPDGAVTSINDETAIKPKKAA